MNRNQARVGSVRWIWGAPVAIGGLTVFGLLAALLGTGAWHWASWLALAAPIAITLRHACMPGSR
jgi:hypothetical protein